MVRSVEDILQEEIGKSLSDKGVHILDPFDRYAANLKRELPRIPYAPDFHAFAKAGLRLAEIHVEYEQRLEYPLKQIENEDLPLNWRVGKMKLTKDKTAIVYNEFLTLNDIPPETFN